MKKKKREQGKRKRVSSYACVHRDDRSFVVIASSCWQTARITHSDARRPTPPPPPPLPCMVSCRMSCVVVYVVYNSSKERKEHPSQSVVSGLLGSKKE
jgi:hypothetical protein